ncbi:L-fucose/L-arabinose isomerase family protein [Candidatus Epulonipiscium viviparus]|uniref:L-fucose/L-arabinose isomerase family protein n=1 Tax=Candidatus Epulonipiscium viviparus TaxID=420336 RepID=UPI000497FF58|nr:hypothetical protein [Candidatus Epulopiscium viviparus]
MRFALFFGNRGFMPAELLLDARTEMAEAVTKAGFEYIMMDEDATRFGAVETRDEGRLYAKWLEENRGNFDGIILCMPIFIDENGAITALEKAGVPILMQAYPDEIGKLDFAHRRDAFCGKFSVTDVFEQYRTPYTVFQPHVVHPLSKVFAENLRDFAAVCRVVAGMKSFNVGCIGARTTAFKTVRFDELTAQRYGINIESFDLSELIFKVQNKANDDAAVVAKRNVLLNYTNCHNVPEENLNNLAKTGVVLDEYIAAYKLDALTLRCWNEMEDILHICPCVLLGELNDRGIIASCEMDLCSAITMRAMHLASLNATACLDWNNNYGDAVDKVILFHCGPVPQSLMAGKGEVTDHKMIAKTDPGHGWGSNEGRIRNFPMTFSNCKMEDGKIYIYFSEGEFTEDVIEDGYFGCAGVAAIENLENKLNKLARNGFKHHTTVGEGHMKKVLEEAFKYYLKYEIIDID